MQQKTTKMSCMRSYHSIITYNVDNLTKNIKKQKIILKIIIIMKDNNKTH